MIEYKQGVAARVPVRFLTDLGAGLAAVAHTAVTVAIARSDGTTATVSITGADWQEVAVGAFAGTGFYLLTLPTTALSVPGLLTYSVATAGAKTHVGAIKVVAREEAETYGIVNTLQKIETGRWKIHTSGPEANRLVIYDQDGTTILYRFNLLDVVGSATYINPFERVPV